jgi:hypothetical protein
VTHTLFRIFYLSPHVPLATALLLLYCAFTAALLLNLNFGDSSTRNCFTTALIPIYCCFTAALLLLYS